MTTRNWKNLSVGVKMYAVVMLIFLFSVTVSLVGGISWLSASRKDKVRNLYTDLIHCYAAGMETVFIDSMNDGRLLAEQVAGWYARTNVSQWPGIDSGKYYREESGAVRSRTEEGDVWGAFLSSKGVLNDRVKRMLQAVEGRIDSHQKAAALRFLNTYIAMPENLTVIDDPVLVGELPPDFDILEQEFFTIATPENNPDRSSVWSSVYYDPFLKSWMISNAAPVYAGDEYLGSVGHDLVLDELLDRISKNQKRVEQSRHIIITADGNLVYHPSFAKMMEESPESFQYKDNKDPELLKSVQRILKDGETSAGAEVEMDGETYLLSASHMASVDWYYVQLVPVDVILADIYRLAVGMIATGLLALALLGWALLFLTRRIISRPLDQGVMAAQQLARGDLAVSLVKDGNDEIGRLLEAMDGMSAKLNRAINQVKDIAAQISQGSEGIRMSAEEMSDGASRQAASAEQVSASMEEMSAGIRMTMENAFETEKIATKASEEAEKTGDAVQKTAEAMTAIARHIAVIEDISNQTRMLSLNATIEASHAGKHGKGFAVVASEVRRLAERTHGAAASINRLVDDSVATAEAANHMLGTLQPDIRKTAELIREVSYSGREQQSGIDQVNRAMLELDEVIQQNAAISEDLASATNMLNGQARELETAVAFFHTRKEESAE